MGAGLLYGGRWRIGLGLSQRRYFGAAGTTAAVATVTNTAIGAAAATAGATVMMSQGSGGASGGGKTAEEQRRDERATEKGKITPKGEREADGILQAEKEGKIDPGRPAGLTRPKGSQISISWLRRMVRRATMM